MSTRAYRLIEVKTEDRPTFNVTHQYELLEDMGVDMENEAIIVIEVKALENLLTNDEMIDKHRINYDQLTRIRIDVMHAKENGDNYIEYWTY